MTQQPCSPDRQATQQPFQWHRHDATQQGWEQREGVRRSGDIKGKRPGIEGEIPEEEQQRVAVARALGGKPSILLADEPTGNLDSRNGEAVMELLSELHREGATICMVTHDPRFAKHAQREVHLFDGKVVAEEELKKLMADVQA